VSGFGEGGGHGQGGGFGPPAGGHPPQGGGFGAPPGGHPPQGGGFGAPPGGHPPQGGGFGAPPAGGTPPPGGGGEGPLAHIPFTPDDEKNLSGMARFARFAGIAAVASAVLQMIAQTVAAFLSEGSPVGQVCGGTVGLVLAGLLAAFLFRVGKAVDLVVQTDDADQLNLVEALKALKGYFMVKGIVYILVIVLGCLCMGSMLIFGAAIAGAIGAST
jgi:hypothetical protein